MLDHERNHAARVWLAMYDGCTRIMRDPTASAARVATAAEIARGASRCLHRIGVYVGGEIGHA